MSDDKHEIVIVRRGGHGDHDEHHGGVWKIAFADFMTAMMAFFLVMWLISANDKTRASVARYFNPVRLVDATTQPRGLHDAKKDESGITASPDTKGETKPDKSAKDDAAGKAGKDGKPDKDAKSEKDAKAETPAARQARLDTALRDNPLVALAEIVATKPPSDPASQPKVSSATIGRRGGEAFRDPFAPPPAQAEGNVADPAAADDTAAASLASDTQSAALKATLPPAVAAGKPDAKTDVKTVLASLNSPQAGAGGPQIEVQHTGEGLLVSFTDTADFSMFATGSAVPARKLVLMMERVAKAVKTLKGSIVVRGFTDNKPFKSGRYDNWHLSLDRAQVTHYMLVRGGLDDGRIGHVEGYADRSAKPGTDPASPLNRRIEILVRDPA